MKLKPLSVTPEHKTHDVVIIGGAVIGSSVAWFLSANKDFNGRVLVVEKDPTYQWCSTAHTNSCIRQQFSNEINIRIAQSGVRFLKSFRENLGGDAEIPEIRLHSFGYLLLANNEKMGAGSTREPGIASILWSGDTDHVPRSDSRSIPIL